MGIFWGEFRGLTLLSGQLREEMGIKRGKLAGKEFY